MKTPKTSKIDTRLCHVLPFHYDVKLEFFHYLNFKRTESSGQVIFFDARVAQAPWSLMLVDPLKTSSLDSVTAYI